MGRDHKKFIELIRVYHDLEKTLKGLRKRVEKNSPHGLSNINVRALIHQLTRSKRQLERKIGNTLLLEKQHLKRRLKAMTNPLSSSDQRR